MEDTIIAPQGVMSLDRYSYVSNAPVVFVDPSGNRTCTEREAATGDETCNQNYGKTRRIEAQEGIGPGNVLGRHLTDKELAVLALLVAGESSRGQVPMRIIKARIWMLLNLISFSQLEAMEWHYGDRSLYQIWRGGEEGSLIDDNIVPLMKLEEQGIDWSKLSDEEQFELLYKFSQDYRSDVYQPIYEAAQEVENQWYAYGPGSNYDLSHATTRAVEPKLGNPQMDGTTLTESDLADKETMQIHRDWIAANKNYQLVTPIYYLPLQQGYRFIIFAFPGDPFALDVWFNFLQGR